MKKSVTITALLVSLLALVICQCDEVLAVNDNAAMIATSILRELGLDTSGVDGYTRAHALIHARESISQLGKDVGVAFTKYIYSDTAQMGMFVDTGVLVIQYIAFDSLIDDEFLLPIRILKPQSLDSVIYGSAHTEAVYAENNAVLYYHQPGSDSVWVGPASLDIDTFTVWGYKEANLLSDSSDTTNIQEKYRWMAVQYGCHLASVKMVNGRAGEFLALYENAVKKIWIRRIGRPLTEINNE